MPTVILCRPLHPSGMALLEARGDVTVRTLNRPSQSDLAAAMPGAHAVLVGLEEVDEALLSQSPDLRIVSRFGVGYDTVTCGLHASRRCGRRDQWRQRPLGRRTHDDADARGRAAHDRDGCLGARGQMDAARRPPDERTRRGAPSWWSAMAVSVPASPACARRSA